MISPAVLPPNRQPRYNTHTYIFILPSIQVLGVPTANNSLCLRRGRPGGAIHTGASYHPGWAGALAARVVSESRAAALRALVCNNTDGHGGGA